MSIGKVPALDGLPTPAYVQFHLGFQIGRTVYPVPHASYNKELDETSLSSRRGPVLNTPIRAPAGIAGEAEK